MQSFPTRLVGSAARSLLLAFCMASCLACATSFPLDTLEVGMTKEQVTEAFGEPRWTTGQELYQAVRLLRKENAEIFERLEAALGASEKDGPMARKLEQLSTQSLRNLEGFVTELDMASREHAAVSIWAYPHEEARWFSYPGSILLLGIPFIADDYLEMREVELLFQGGRLLSWENRVLRSPFQSLLQGQNGYLGYGNQSYGYQAPFPSTNTWLPSKNTSHHGKGHKHHKRHASGYKNESTPSRAPAPKHDHSRGPKNPSRNGSRKHK
ncbi:MAG: hypothetical protein O7B29_13220 [Deltaproteobacteria bacterium]|nr:hypothetical protein [Deltaproteobacteria bacterium]